MGKKRCTPVSSTVYLGKNRDIGGAIGRRESLFSADCSAWLLLHLLSFVV